MSFIDPSFPNKTLVRGAATIRMAVQAADYTGEEPTVAIVFGAFRGKILISGGVKRAGLSHGMVEQRRGSL